MHEVSKNNKKSKPRQKKLEFVSASVQEWKDSGIKLNSGTGRQPTSKFSLSISFLSKSSQELQVYDRDSKV